MAKTVGTGIKSLYLHPRNGMKEEGVKGAVKGVAKGAAAFVASPLVGVAVVFEKISMGIHDNLQLLDESRYDVIHYFNYNYKKIY